MAAAALLGALASGGELPGAAEVLRRTVAALGQADSEAQAAAFLWALCKLVEDDAKNQDAVVEQGSLVSTLHILNDGGDGSRHAALSFLTALAKPHVHREAIVKSEFVPAIVRCLVDASPPAQLGAARLLLLLAQRSDGRECLVRSGGVPALAALESTPELGAEVAEILQRLAAFADLSAAVAEVRAMDGQGEPKARCFGSIRSCRCHGAVKARWLHYSLACVLVTLLVKRAARHCIFD